MNTLIQQFLESPALIILAVCLFFSSSITTLDTRLIQAKRSGELPPDHPNLPTWAGIFIFVDYGLILALLVLNWRVGLAVVTVRFVLKVLPVLETVGNMLMAPFKSQASDKQIL